MGKRGRPRHPDILTPREWEVLALIRDGLTNEEIAGRLTISVDGVKYHVSQILSKLGVSSRAEAAAWTAEQRPWWQGALAPIAFLWRRTVSFASRLSPLSSALAVGLMAGAIGGLAALAFLVFYTSHRSESAVAEPPSVIPTPVNGWPGMMQSFFVDDLHGWVSLRNVLFQTVDGGATWTREYEAPDDISSVFFSSAQTGWLLSRSELNGTELWMSEDGGRTWSDTGRTAPGAVRFVGAVNGWATNQLDQIWKTSDGGISWQVVDGPCLNLARSENGAISTGGAPKVKVVSRPSSFIDPDTGWSLCAESSLSGQENKLFQTTDSGNHWKRLVVFPWDSISLQFIDKRHGWLLDDTGLHATSDGGRSWHTVALFTKSPGFFSGVQFVSERQGFLDYNGGISGPSAIFGTQDGGRTWTQLYAGPPPLSAPDVRPCTAADIDASMLGAGPPLRRDGFVSGIDFRNKLRTACKLNGVPQIDLVDGNGDIISLAVNPACQVSVLSMACGHPLEDVVLIPKTSVFKPHATLPPGQASLSMSWSESDSEVGTCSVPSALAASIRIHLPEGAGDIIVDVAGSEWRGIRACKEIRVSWFQPTAGAP